MKGKSTFLSSKVARRIFALFVCCALAPTCILAWLSYHRVSNQLRDDSQKQLSQLAKAQAMEVFERLEIAEATLSPQGEAKQESGGRNPFKDYFLSLGVFDHDARLITSSGSEINWLGIVTPNQDVHSTHSFLTVYSCSRGLGNCVALIKPVLSGKGRVGWVVGEINPIYLWGSERLPASFDICVQSAVGAKLFCSDPASLGLVEARPKDQRARFSGYFQGNYQGTAFNAAYWSLLLRPTFSTESWVITVSQKQEEVLSPLRAFRNSFLLVILLALLAVSLASSVQIRRTLVPLEKLQAATLQVGEQHFEGQVEIRSGDEFENLASSFNSMTRRLGQQFHALKTINDIGQTIFASLNYEAIADGVLDHMPYLMACDCLAVAIIGDSAHGGWMRYKKVEVERAQSIVDLQCTAREKQHFEANPQSFSLEEGARVPGFIEPLRLGSLRSFVVFPIFVDKTPFGALIYGYKSAASTNPEELQQARQVADQVAVAFANAQMVEALEKLHWGTLTALARAIDAKSAWTAGHSERVTNLSLRIGHAMHLSAKELQIMHRGGLLHDIGKIGTPATVLDKPGKLEAQEMQVMQDHVRIGARILEPIPGFREALPIVLQHHEWFDGTGYPGGLAGDEISLHARIFAVADCYDAMKSDRPYRKGLPRQKVMEIITQQSGTHFDPQVVRVFVAMMAEENSEDIQARAATSGDSV